MVLLITVCSIVATMSGIFSIDGVGKHTIESFRGNRVEIYGKGLYGDMSADVAVQGIAQDWVTLLVGVPLLLIGLFLSRRNSLRGIFLLSGTLSYFFLTYLFYTAMAMYNRMFLVYVLLLGASFFAFILNIFSYDINKLKDDFKSEKILKYAGIFLMINSTMIGFLWLSIVVPPLFDGTIVPVAVEHYTTLIVQGFDLGLFLPMTFVSGFLAFKKNIHGYLFTVISILFLSLLMIALTSKVLFMANAGQNVIPVIFIIPTICLTAIGFSVLLLKNVKS